MPKIQLIINGDFNNTVNGANQSSVQGWTGTDMEFNREGVYLRNSTNRANRVAELDGYNNRTTVMEQVFTVPNSGGSYTTDLTFDAALRTTDLSNAGQEGFTVEIVNSSGVVVASSSILPTVDVMQGYSLPVSLVGGQTYTLRITEIGIDNGLGAILDNVSILICFAGQTLIDCETGPKRADQIVIGDRVLTQDGFKPVRWVGRRKITAQQMEFDEKLRPVRFKAGSLGNKLPARDLWVTRQHRMLVDTEISQHVFGERQALISAIKLTVLDGVEIEENTQDIEYVHFLFDNHEVVFAEGAPAESLLFGERAKQSLTQEAIEEIELIFGNSLMEAENMKPAALIARGAKQAEFAERLASKKKRAPLEALYA